MIGRNKSFVFLIVVLFVLNLGIVSASFSFGNFSINQKYSGGELISGLFNMSFDEQNNDYFESSLGGNITLNGLLEKSEHMEGPDYICNPSSCQNGFASSNGQTTKDVNLEGKETVGLLLQGNNVEISNFSINIVSDFPETCVVSQVSVDLLDDGTIDFMNFDYIDDLCGNKLYGCFDEDDVNGEQLIGNVPYCEKISLFSAPAYRIGAKVNKTADGGELKMEMYDLSDEGFLGRCDLPSGNLGENEMDCIVNYSSPSSFDALVCILDSGNSGKYQINRETKDVCGMFGVDFSQGFAADYEIYAQRLRYASVDFNLNQKNFERLNPESDMLGMLQEYLDEVYNSECGSDCVIPISFLGGSQEVIVSGVNLKYLSSIGETQNNRIYDLEKTSFTLSSSGYLDFNLEDLGFVAPNVEGTKMLNINFSGEIVGSRVINISSGFNFSISPRFSLIGQNTLFKAIISENISSSIWNFGDGNIVNSNSDEATHKYLEEGTFNVEVALTNVDGEVSTNTFSVVVGDAKTSANLTINDYRLRISNLTESVNTFPAWLKTEIEKSVNPTDLGTRLNNLKQNYNLATTDEDYLQIMNSLLAMRVPYSLRFSSNGSLPLELGLENIDGRYVEELSLEEDVEELEERIVAWMQRNYDVKVDFELYSLFYDDGQEDVLTRFKLNIDDVGNLDSAYLFIDYAIDSVKFKEDYGQKRIGGGAATYIPLGEGDKEIEFSLAGKIRVGDLGAYISPDVKKLPVLGGTVGEPVEPKRDFDLKKYLIWTVVLIIVFIVIYIILQEWYKRNYELHLFSSKDLLYNLLSFIYNGRKSGLRDSEVRDKLRKSGWNREQISYAFKKIDGKRTGMFEIPLFKGAENRKVKKEIQKRQAGRVDARFIKSPRM